MLETLSKTLQVQKFEEETEEEITKRILMEMNLPSGLLEVC